MARTSASTAVILTSCSSVTPGYWRSSIHLHRACLGDTGANPVVFGPGGYRFGDFIRAGAAMNNLIGVVSMLVIMATRTPS